MRRFFALLCAALLACLCFACGEKPEPAPTPDPTPDPTPMAKEIHNNGGRYVQYGGDVFYWEYWAACIEPSAIWGQFPEVPGIRRSMMRGGESLFIENGCGNIWMHDGRFYLTWLDDGYTPRIFSTSMERGNAMGDALDRRALGPGTIFALDEERGLLIACVDRVNEDTHRVECGLCVISTGTGERVQLPIANAEPLLYDAPTLYYRDFSGGEWNVVKLCAADILTGGVREIALVDTGEFEDFEDADAVECDNAWLEGGTLYAFLSGYSGNAHMRMGGAQAIIDLAGGGMEYEHWEDAPDYMREGVGRPFEYSGEWYVCFADDTSQLVLSREDLAGLGLPGGPFYGEESFADVRDLEYVDGTLYFAVVRGPRNPEADIGWREAYDFDTMDVYRKDIATGEIETLYSFDKTSMRG